MENIVGKFYSPLDNSFCINVHTNKNAWLLPWVCGNQYNPTNYESNAYFTIFSNPYKEMVKSYGGERKETFIKVKSSVTGNIYRTLYFENGVIEYPNFKQIFLKGRK